jgi:preprotein translocase subunit YajC
MDATSLLLPLIILLPLLLLIMRQRKQQREFVAQQERLSVGDRIMTTAGLYGTVTRIDADTMQLEVAPGLTLTWAKAAIGRIITEPAATTKGTAGADREDGSGPDLTKSDPA